MVLHPADAYRMLRTTTVGGPVATHSSVGSLPTIVPDIPEFITATSSGHRALWVVFVLLTISTIGFVALSWTVPLNKRIYHTLLTIVTAISALAYFGMATGQAYTWQLVQDHVHNKFVPDTEHHIYRQFFWAHYVDWALTLPLLVVNLGYLSSLSGGHTLITLVASEIFVFSSLFSRLSHPNTLQRWGWFVFVVIGYLTVVWHVVVNGRNGATSRSNKLGNYFTLHAGYFILVLTAFPIVWGIALGKRELSVNHEIIVYAVLDLLIKPVFGIWLVLTLNQLPESNPEVDGIWSNGLGSTEGRVRLIDDQGA